MAAITQLTPSAIPGQRYGSFAGKEASEEPAGPHNPGRITQLTPSAIPGGRYGSFAGKGESVEPEPQPTVQSSKGMYDEPAFLRGVRRKKDKKRKPLREELIEAFAEIRVVPELAPQVAAAVAEYVIQKPGPRPAVPAVERVDWAALRVDLDAVRHIFELYARLEARRRDEEDDDDLMLLH